MNKPKPKTAILYARFSPRPKAAECESCESQLVDLRAYCKRNGWEVAGEYSDKALSGGNDWEDRPGMFDAATACKRGMLFVVRNFHRLFRDTEKALVFKSMIERKGCRIYSATEESACDNSPIGNLVATIFLAIAEYDRAITRARTRAKMREHQANGRAMSKQAPYGMMADPAAPGRWVANPIETTAIETIRVLWSKGQTLRGIARTLTERKLGMRGGRPWNHVQVGRILRREGLM